MTHVIYRLSDNGYKKPKLANATKLHCLQNAMDEWDKIHLFVDETNLLDSTRHALLELKDFVHFEFYVGGSSAGSFRHVFNYAMKTLQPEDVVYFLEDDYLHLPGSADVLLEGLGIADYVSLYDHKDKYIPASKGGNPYIDEDGGEVTKVYRTKSIHWKLTNSTTMTFATTIAQLHVDEQIWNDFSSGTHPNDFGCFMTLRGLGRSLITSLPGLSTHCEPAWLSPGIDWERV